MESLKDPNQPQSQKDKDQIKESRKFSLPFLDKMHSERKLPFNDNELRDI